MSQHKFRKKKPEHKSNLKIKPGFTSLCDLLEKYGLTLNQFQLEQLWKFHRLLRIHNHDRDLTRLIGFETIVQRHYADSIFPAMLLNKKLPSPLADIGTGAGFPGIPLKIFNPKIEMMLCEPRPRRVEFLKTAISELKLEGMSVFNHKVTSKSFTIPVSGIITRAFEPFTKTLLRIEKSLQPGGLAIFMKGPKLDEELPDFKEGDYKIEADRKYEIPNTELQRRLLVLQRIK